MPSRYIAIARVNRIPSNGIRLTSLFNKPESKTGRASGFADLHNSNAVPRSPGSKAIDLKCRSGESEAAKSGPETAPIGISEN
jgi:hypothetical protein